MHYQGGCHCGAVRYEFEAPSQLEVLDCNCSICSMVGYLHLIVPQDKVKITGEQHLTRYGFNTGAAQHLFCKHCGIKSFYIPRSHPDCYSINLRCVEGVDPSRVTVTKFDGANWEQAFDEVIRPDSSS